MAVDRDKILQAAQKLVEKKRFDKAIVEYQKLVDDDPKDVRTLLKIGDLYLKLGQHVEAIATYERVGQFYSTQGFHAKAVAVFKQIREIILKHVPHLEDRFGHIAPILADTYAKLGLVGDALATYEEVAARYQRAGRDRDAIDVFRKVVDIDPKNPLPELRLAEAYMRAKDVDSAIEHFGAAADLLLKLGRRDDALRVVDRLLQHRADPKFARIAAEIHLERREPSDAMSALSKLQICFKDNPKDLDTLALLARAFDRLGQPAKAIEVQKEAARIAKDTGKLDHFDVLVDVLIARAPNDDGVRHFAAMRAGSQPPAPIEEAASEAPPALAPAAQAAQTAQAGPAQPASGERPVAGTGHARPAPVIPQPAASSPARPPPPQKPPVPPPLAPAARPHELEIVEDATEDVVLDDYDEQPSSSAAPFALKPATYPPPPGPAAGNVGPLGPGIVGPAQRVRQILHEVDNLRHAKVYDRAVTRLFDGIAELPTARELREKLCDVYIEAGDQAEAVHQMLEFARWLTAGNEIEDATRILDEVLLLEPDQPDAIVMLRDLGYAVPTDEAGEAQAFGEGEATSNDALHPGDHDPALEGPRGDGYDPEAPLPAYDLEYSQGGRGTHAVGHEPQAAQAASPGLDDPFAEAPLPAFDLEEEATRYASRPRSVPPPAESGTHWTGSDAAVEPVAAPHPPYQAQLDEAALEEVEFFATNGMFDEARGLLEAELARLPNHPLLLERLRELEEHAAGAQGGESGTLLVPRNGAGSPGAGSVANGAPAYASDDRSFDIAASLDALDALDSFDGSQAQASASEPGQVSVESVFQQFKAGVAAQISESDASTHYDLGAAYKEMGLATDAIAEFDLASRDPGRECVCLWMIGMIYRESHDLGSAVDSFIRAMKARVRTPEQDVALMYEIGDCYEAAGQRDQALYYFQRVARQSPGYDDLRGAASERARALDPAPPAKPAAKAVGSDTVDEFDAALDDLIGAKLP